MQYTIGRVSQPKLSQKDFFKRNLVGTCSGLACHHVSRFYFKKKLVSATMFLRGNQTSRQTTPSIKAKSLENQQWLNITYGIFAMRRNN